MKADIQAGRAFVELFLKDKAFVKGLNAASMKLRNFGRGMGIVGAAVTAAGTAIVAPLLAMTRQFAESGSELFDMAQRTNMSVGALQELSFAAEQTGSSMQVIERAIHKAREQGHDFFALAGDIAAIQDPAKQSQKALELFGARAGAQIAPLLRELPKLREQYKRLAIAISDEAAAAADVLGDAFTDLRLVLKSASMSIGEVLAPAVTKAVLSITNIVIRVRDWIRENQGLFVTAMKIGLAVSAIGAIITTLGVALIAAGVSIAAFNTLLGVAVGLLSAVLSPISLVVGALIGLATWFVTSTEWGRQFVTSLVEWFGDLLEVGRETFAGIADALAADDLALAAKVAWAGIQLAWLEGTNELRVMWAKFKDFYLRTTTEMVFSAQRIWVRVTTGVKGLGAIMINFLANVANKMDEQFGRIDRAEFERRRAGLAKLGVEEAGKIEDEENKQLQEIERDRKAASEDRDSQFNRDKKIREDALKAAKAELATLREKAAVERKNKELKAAPKFEQDKFEFDSTTAKREVFGTFSAAALAAQSGADTAADQVKELRREQRMQHKETLRAMMEQRREEKLLS